VQSKHQISNFQLQESFKKGQYYAEKDVIVFFHKLIFPLIKSYHRTQESYEFCEFTLVK